MGPRNEKKKRATIAAASTRRRIVNPATGRAVFADGSAGRCVLAVEAVARRLGGTALPNDWPKRGSKTSDSAIGKTKTPGAKAKTPGAKAFFVPWNASGPGVTSGKLARRKAALDAAIAHRKTVREAPIALKKAARNAARDEVREAGMSPRARELARRQRLGGGSKNANDEANDEAVVRANMMRAQSQAWLRRQFAAQKKLDKRAVRHAWAKKQEFKGMRALTKNEKLKHIGVEVGGPISRKWAMAAISRGARAPAGPMRPITKKTTAKGAPKKTVRWLDGGSGNGKGGSGLGNVRVVPSSRLFYDMPKTSQRYPTYKSPPPPKKRRGGGLMSLGAF